MALGGIIFAIVYGIFAYAVGPAGASYMTSVQFLPLCTGAILALNEGFLEKLAARKLALLTLLAGIVLHGLSFSGPVRHFPADHYLPHSLFDAVFIERTLDLSGYLTDLSHTALSLSVVLFCLGVVERQPWAWRLRAGWLRDLGMMTYGIYLFHLYIFFKFGVYGHGGASPWMAMAALFTTLGVTAISFYLVESRFINWGKRLRQRAKARRVIRCVPGPADMDANPN
jgi:peptidoglycan/LPS O-acetylase OafA/YrhL